MKVAFATEDLEHVDAHFGWTPQLAVYDVTADGARQVRVHVFPDAEEDGSEDKVEPRPAAVEDCAILYVAAIGGPAAARVVGKGVHPILAKDEEEIAVLIERLRAVLAGTPLPWLRKALRKEGCAA